MRILWISAALLLVGCASDHYVDENAAKCASFGAKPRTPEFVQCMATLTAADREARSRFTETPGYRR
jgi:hypothetical protein